jgi:TetR/AcrR family transcriptional regulator
MSLLPDYLISNKSPFGLVMDERRLYADASVENSQTRPRMKKPPKPAPHSVPKARTTPPIEIKHSKRPAKERRREPDKIRARVLAAALNAFSLHGFEGASTRLIAEDANVSISLLLYHFKSKDQLWKAVMESLAQHASVTSILDRVGANASTSDKIRVVIRSLVTAFAEAPALHRLMTLEAPHPSKRLMWLCETYVQKDFDTFCGLIAEGQREGTVRKVNPARLRYAIVAIAAVPFSVAAEYQYVTKRNPFSAAEIENAVDFIEHLVFENVGR